MRIEISSNPFFTFAPHLHWNVWPSMHVTCICLFRFTTDSIDFSRVGRGEFLAMQCTPDSLPPPSFKMHLYNTLTAATRRNCVVLSQLREVAIFYLLVLGWCFCICGADPEFFFGVVECAALGVLDKYDFFWYLHGGSIVLIVTYDYRANNIKDQEE